MCLGLTDLLLAVTDTVALAVVQSNRQEDRSAVGSYIVHVRKRLLFGVGEKWVSHPEVATIPSGIPENVLSESGPSLYILTRSCLASV